MKKLFHLLPILISTATVADSAAPPALTEWIKINGIADTSFEKYIDTKAIRQTGPMNTMRRVWEISNLTKIASNKVLSIKRYMEYDCKDRRIRVLEESGFSEHWAQGATLTTTALDAKSGKWNDITDGSAVDIVFKRVCPSDESDTTTN